MKIVIPTNDKKGLNGNVAEHFGRCLTYTFINEKGEVIEIINNISEHMGGSGLPPELMKKHKADILLCRELGPRALILCKDLDIDVYVFQAKTVREFFEMWKNNKLKKAGIQNSCNEHKL